MAGSAPQPLRRRRTSSFATQTADVEYEAVAEEYIKGYFAARPLQGTALGLHEYDGKITDYSRLALDAELSRQQRVCQSCFIYERSACNIN